MDIAASVEHICKDAKFKRSDTYANLVKSWGDARPVPTEMELAVAWAELLEQRFYQAAKDEIVHDMLTVLRDKKEREELSIDERLNHVIEVLIAYIPPDPSVSS